MKQKQPPTRTSRKKPAVRPKEKHTYYNNQVKRWNDGDDSSYSSEFEPVKPEFITKADPDANGTKAEDPNKP